MENKYAELGLELFEDCYEIENPDALRWEVSEAETDDTGAVDGVGVLGRAVGPFFVVDGKSQNNRFYERKLWDRVLGEANQTMARGQMLGTIGHGQPLDDNALLEGKASHRVSKLWIDEGKKMGMGEVLLLNTPAGRTLNAYLRGGVQFPVSSRGYGKYNGKMEDGTQVVDSDTYKLETFDFVRVPGIANAIPQIVESKEEETSEPVKAEVTPGNFVSMEDLKIALGSLLDEKNTPDPQAETSKGTVEVQEETIMADENSGQVLTKMTEEKIRLEEELARALEANAQLAETNEALTAATNELQQTVEEYRNLGSIEHLSQVMDVTETMLQNRPMEESDMVALVEQLEIYEELGTPEELEELFDKFESFIDGYDELGTPDELHEALDRSVAMLEAYNELGTPEEVNEAFNSVESFMGEMANLGTLEELDAVCDLLEAYQEYGTPNELAHAFQMMNSVVENTRAKHIEAESRALAAEYNVDSTVAESIVEAMGSARATEVLGAINESRSITSRYRVQDSMNEEKEGELNESAPTGAVGQSLFGGQDARASRLMEKMGR